MAAELERPGVQVYQEFTTTTPTVLRPQMPACIVGPSYQLVEAVEDDGTLNADSIVTVPARLTSAWVSTPFQFTGAGGDALYLSVNNAAEVTLTLPGTNPTVEQVVDYINGEEVTGLIAEVEESGTQQRLVLRTTGTDSNATIRVGTSTHADVISALGITKGYKYRGASGYNNYLKTELQIADYPDPRDNMDDLTIDYDSVRVFINPGDGSAREVLRTESFLQGATSAVTVQDDGDSDNLSPYLNFASAVFKKTAATLTGTSDLTSTYGSLGTGTLILKIDGGSPVTTTFATPVSAAAAVTAINTAHGSTVASLNGSNQLVITSPTTGPGSSVERTGGSVSAGNIGFATGAYAAGKQSKARAQGTTDLTALTYSSQVQSRDLVLSVNGGPWQTITMGSSTATAAAVLTDINTVMGTIATLNGANNLVLTATDDFGGVESCIRLDAASSDATLLTALGLTTSGGPFETVEVVHGNPIAPMVGDEVWVDGVRVGTVTEIPTSVTNRLRLDAEQLLTFSGSTWFIVAKGLDNSAATSTRPSSALRIDENTGTITLKHEQFHDTAGAAVTALVLSTYVGYTALRKDVSPAKADGTFNLYYQGSLTDLETEMSPIDTSNPLALGMYFAMLNAPGLEVTGCGVDEAPSTAPEGSVEAYARAFEFLESKDVYAIVPLTHSTEVGAIGKLHVDAMSEPANALERIVILNPSCPTRKSATLVASGTAANVSGAPSDVVQTGVANLQALLAAAGVPGPTFDIDDGVYLELEDDTNKYLVASVSGGAVTINNGALTDNDDGFYFDNENSPVFDEAIVDRPFSIKIRGAAIASRTEEAVAYADIARGYLDRRVIVTAPDAAVATIDSLATRVAGYYMGAALAGRKSAKAPQQPLTEDLLVGFTAAVGSADRYSEPQLRVMSGGGLWVFYTEDGTEFVRTRHQLTSDMTSLQVRESSITDALDFAAKTLRATFKNFAGRYNITTSLQDALSLVADGVRDFVLRNGVFKEFDIVAIQQDESELDAMNVIYDVGVYYPANKIRITMRVS